VISLCTRRCFGSLIRWPNMKLFDMTNEVGQHAIERGCPKDTFINMQAGPVTVGSKREKDGIHIYTRN
jgi:hypothetical protein